VSSAPVGSQWWVHTLRPFQPSRVNGARAYYKAFAKQTSILTAWLGEKGPPYILNGSYFYRIIDRFIDQTGVDNAQSIYGGQFKDDPGGLKLQHDRPYLISIANGGPNTNTAHFSITVAPAHHLDGQ